MYKNFLSSYPSSVFHFSKASLLISGTSWLLTPPNTLLVASEAMIIGLTIVGGICRNTPPTAPLYPFCSLSCEATRRRLSAVSPKPQKKKKCFNSIGCYVDQPTYTRSSYLLLKYFWIFLDIFFLNFNSFSQNGLEFISAVHEHR